MRTYLYLSTAVAGVIMATGNALGQCVVTQDCAAMGYTKSSCPDGKGVKCPFGNKWACIKSDSECEQQFCDKYGFQYTCSGTGYSGGSGTACGGKYAACTCTSGYEWKDGSCRKQKQNGAVGELYYCNGKVVGVRATGMGFYVALRDLGEMKWYKAIDQCSSYVFCGSLKGTLPTKDQLLTLYNNKSRVNSLLSTNGGTQLTNSNYWSSTFTGHNDFYTVYMVTGNASNGSLASNHYVRPVLASW